MNSLGRVWTLLARAAIAAVLASAMAPSPADARAASLPEVPAVPSAATAAPVPFASGSAPEIRGAIGPTALASPLQTPQAGIPVATTAATRRIALIIGTYSDLAGAPVTQPDARDTFINATASVRAYFAATSRGRVDMTTPLVLGPLSLGIPQCSNGYWSFSNSLQAAIAAAAARGYNLSSYEHIVLWTKAPCGVPTTAGGVSDIGGRRVQLFLDWNSWPVGWDPDKTTMSALIASHELGHNLGLHHANGLDCRDGSGNQIEIGGTCTNADRWDRYSSMGGVGAPYHSLLDADRLQSLGWLDSNEWQTVGAVGTYTLVPVYSSSPGVRLLRIPRPAPVVAAGQSGAWTLEIRSTLTGTPWDQFSATAELPDLPSVTTGVTIRYSEDQFRAQNQLAESYLVDTTADAGTGQADFWDAPLQPGQTFTDAAGGFTITVVSVTGTGATVTIGDTMAPTAPLSLEGVAIPAGGAQLDWQAASDNLGLGSYRIYRDSVQIAEVTASTLTYTDPPAGFGGLHTYSVAGVDTAGNVGATIAADVTLAPPPGAPTAATAVAGNSGALVSWTAPAPNGGPAVASYTATSAPGGLTCTTVAPATSCVVMGLTNGTPYTFTVTATNSVGTGPPSDPSNSVIPLAVPGRPTGVSGVPDDTTVAVSWSAPGDAGAGPITGYTVTASPGPRTCTTLGTIGCTVTGLTNGVAYTFTVSATNLLGQGLPSDASAPVTPRTRPDPPVGVTALASNGSAQVTWGAPPFDGGSPVIGYDVVSSPDGRTCHTGGIRTCTVYGLTNRTWYTFTVTATNAAGRGDPSDASPRAMPLAGATYFAVTPNRLVDSRAGTRLGLGASLSHNAPVTFQVTDRSTDPAQNIPANAIAVTGNLTAVRPGAKGYFSLTPDRPVGIPRTSALNFTDGDIRANNVTVKLGSGGGLWITFVASAGKTADIVFDVTGYFAANTSGATYVPLTPNRVLDSRSPTRLGMPASLTSGTPASFQVTELSSDPTLNVPSAAIAVTGNLTATNQASKGFFSLASVRPSGTPTTSTINFPAGDTRADGVTVPLGSGGILWVTFIGAAGTRADVVFDVTGYFVPDVTGATYVPVTPNRLADSRPATRLGLGASLTSGTPAEFTVTERSSDPLNRIPSGSLAITGNLTATNEASAGFLALTPLDPGGLPDTSTINFPARDNRANGVTVLLGPDGGLWVTFVGTARAVADAVFDVTGYFTMS